MTFALRAAGPDDVEVVVELIHALAAYEKLSDACRPDAAALREHLFGARPVAAVELAEESGVVVGFALYFSSYSTFLTKPGLYLEDLFVRPEARGRGVGRALLERLAGIAVARGCGRFEWSVLDWNEPAIAFYEKLGARRMHDWTVCRVDGAALEKLAKRSR